MRTTIIAAAIIVGILSGQIPLLPDSTRTTITVNGDGTVSVSGSAGAAPPDGTVNITNGGTTAITAATDGSFSAVLTAASGNQITVGISDGPGKIALVVGDSDGDKLSDAEEATRGTNPTNTNTDGDGFPDGFEVAAGSDLACGAGAPHPVCRHHVWEEETADNKNL